MPALFLSARLFLSSARTRQLLLWCLPALLVALAFRAVLTVQMPYAFYHDDTPDFLTTPDELLHRGGLELHEKKTFLAPLLFTLPFLTGVPALLLIPLGLHMLGLATILLAGALCRHWFRHWRAFIIPITLLLALDPALLWYEHTLMAESIFLFTTALVAYAGTIYTLAATRGRFIFLLCALFLEAGARPEGKLLFGFGLLLLVILHARALPSMWPRLAGLVALAIATHFITRTGQAGLLLYTSVARFTPAELKCAPGFDPYIAAIRADLQARWADSPSFPRVRDRRAIAAAVRQYQKDCRAKSQPAPASANELCLQLAKETCRRNFIAMPIYALEKFRAVSAEAPSGHFDAKWLYHKQTDSFTKSPRSYRLAKGLTGRALETEDQATAFFHAHYHPLEWFEKWQAAWVEMLAAMAFPPGSQQASLDDDSGVLSRTTPLYFYLGAAGVLVIGFRRGGLQRFHLPWGLCLVAIFFVVMLTANVKPRFRFVFEPYWFIYAGLLLESLWLLVSRPFRRL